MDGLHKLLNAATEPSSEPSMNAHRVPLSFRSSSLGDTLRHLFLAGNPICLLPAYRQRVLRGGYGPGLVILDDMPVSLAEQRSAAAAAEAATGVASTPEESGQECRSQARDMSGRRALDLVHFEVKVGGAGIV